MPITPCGYAVGTGIFTPAEIHQMQTSITATINRVRVNIPSFPQTRSPWHQDATDTHSPIVLACWMPLVDATAANGTLEVLPGRYEAP